MDSTKSIPTTGFATIVSGIEGCEGPLVTIDNRIVVVEPSSGSLFEITKSGKTILQAQTSGIPAGLQLHADGSIWIADMQRGILRTNLEESRVEEMVTNYRNEPIRGCNDCYFDSLGNLYFTAPAGSSLENPIGELYFRSKNGFVRQLDSGFAFCNGLAVSSDDKLLIVAETLTKQLYGYRMSAPGKIVEKFLFATLPGDHFGGPDGIEFDADGNVIATNWGGGSLDIFSPDGNLEQRIALPFDKPSNLHFEGPFSKNLLVTEHTTNSLWRGEWRCHGQMQFGWSPILSQ